MSDSEILSYQFSSNFRNNGSLSDAEYILNEDINNISGIKLRNFCAPLTIPLVDSRNNKLYLRETTSGSVVTVTLTTGNYIVNGTNSNSILLQIEQALEANSPNTWSYSVSYSEITNRITISSTNGSFAFVDGLDNFYYEMGFNSGNFGTFAGSQTGAEPIDCSGLKILHIVSNIRTSKVFSKNFSILGSIIIEEENLQVTSYDDQSSDYAVSDLKSMSSLRISFYDERFRKLTFNKDYYLTINFVVD